MSVPDLATKSRRLFASTSELLGLDPKHLTLAQKVRVDRASALRLQIDDLQSTPSRMPRRCGDDIIV